MAVATHKTVLFIRAKVGTKLAQWPVSAFASAGQAKVYAQFLKLAYAANSLDQVKQLDPGVKLAEDGALPTSPKFSIVELSYNPAPPVDDDIDSEDATS